MSEKRTPLNQINNGYAVCLIFVPIIGALFFDPIIRSIFGVDTFNIFNEIGRASCRERV